VLLAALAGTTLLVGCGAGQQTQTASKEPSVPGVSANLRDIALRNVQIGYPDRESRSYPQDGTAPLEVRIFNSGTDADALIGVRSDAAAAVLLVGSTSEGSNVCPEASVSLPATEPTGRPSRPARPATGTTPSDTAGLTPVRPAGTAEFSIELTPGSCALLLPDKPYRLELTGLREELAPGGVVPVTFSFREAGEVTLRVPFGLPTEGPEHSPVDIHPAEPPVVGGHE
jgi:hypothetical protein